MVILNAYIFEPLITSGKEMTKETGIEPGSAGASGKRGGIKNAIYSLFDQKGANNVSYDECAALAKSIKPGTAFNRNHFSWYKRDYRLKPESHIPQKGGEKRDKPVGYYNDCVKRISGYLGTPLVKEGRVLYGSEKGDIKIICLVSKTYESNKDKGYWYGFQDSHKDILTDSSRGYAALGCGSADKIILIPIERLQPLLENMHKTERETGFYWHVQIHEKDQCFHVDQPLGEERVDITEYCI